MLLIVKQIPHYFVIATLLVAGAVYAQDEELSSPQEEPGPARNDAVAISPMDQVVAVADDASDIPGVAPAPEMTDIELLAQQFELYKELINDGVYDEADTVAKRVVELALKTSGPNSIEMAKALTNLAIVQHRNQQYDPAQQNFQAAIEIIEELDNRLSADLVNPLKGLGASQLEGGRPDLANVSFGRAVHITHVNEGPHNWYQLELLQSLAEVSLRLGDTDQAKDLQDRMYALNVRQYSGDTMELIPPLIQRANWQHRVGLIVDERATYRRIIQIIEDNGGKDDPQLVQPLIAYGRSFLSADLTGATELQASGVGSGEIYYKRALKIAEDQPESAWKIKASSLLALGDYYMFIGNLNRARKVYVEAWELLSATDEGLEFRRNLLERPVLLEERPLPQYVSDSPGYGSVIATEQYLKATMTVTYDISTRGRISSLTMVEAAPQEFTDMHRTIQRYLRARAYRPRFADAEPVVTPDNVLVHTFYYRQEDLDALLQEPDESTESEETTTADAD